MEEQTQEQERFPLDEVTSAYIAELDGHIQAAPGRAQAALDQALASLNGQRQAALVLFVRRHKLDGDWKLAENKSELVRTPAPAAGVATS